MEVAGSDGANDNEQSSDPDTSVAYGVSRSMLKGGMNAGGMPVDENIQPTMTSNGCGAVCYYTRQSHSEFAECGVASALKNRDYKDFTDIIQEKTVDKKYILRRLTPTECARLQGFPDWWCDGANGSDSAQYKLWGNGVALPCVAFIMSGIAEELKKSE